jgi:hypothetical protein
MNSLLEISEVFHLLQALSVIAFPILTLIP